MYAALWEYRAFVWRRGLTLLFDRYATTSIGALWAVLKPLMMLGVYALAFGVFLRRAFEGLEVPYVVFLSVALIPFTSFNECLSQCSITYKRDGALIQKVPIPVHIFLADRALSFALDAVLAFAATLGVIFIWDQLLNDGPSVVHWTWLLTPIPLALLMVSGYGISVVLATLYVLLPDTRMMLQVGLRVLFWTAPVLFPLSFFSESGLGWLPFVNPCGASVHMIRSLTLDGAIPGPLIIANAVGVTLLMLVLAAVVHRALGREIRDLL